MFLERVAIFTLQLRAKLKTFLISLINDMNSQIAPLVFLGCLFLLTLGLYYVWIISSSLWIKLISSIIYFLCFLVCFSAIYFHLKQKRVRKNSNNMEVYTLSKEGSEYFYPHNIKVIPLTEAQAERLFREFSKQYFTGSYQSFRALSKLKSIPAEERIVWIDTSPKRPKEVNRQSLLAFLNQLLINFKELENQQMIDFTQHYFILKNPAGKELSLSTKNISDWRTNEAPYLKDITALFQNAL